MQAESLEFDCIHWGQFGLLNSTQIHLASRLSVSSQTSPFTILSVWLSFLLCWKVDSRTRLVYDQHFCLSSTGGLFLRWGALFIETHSNPKGSVPQIHSFLVFLSNIPWLPPWESYFPVWETQTIRSLSPRGVGYSSNRVQQSLVRLGFDNTILWINLTYGVTGGAPVIQPWTAYSELEVPNSNWISPWHCISLSSVPFETTFWYTRTGLSTIHTSLNSESWTLLEENISVTEEYWILVSEVIPARTYPVTTIDSWLHSFYHDG